VATSLPSAKSIFQGYQPRKAAYDELMENSGDPRAFARPFIQAINGLGQEEFQLRWQQAKRLVHENGLAYSGQVTPNDSPRPWELDAVPLLISSAEWETVSAALKQRARLLNLVLQDLYGEQTLLKNGVLPANLVFSHPGFLRSYLGHAPPTNGFLSFYSADLARSPNGDWWVLADRTEAPSGLGYALENRIVISRMLPDVFRDCRIRRLAPFFISVQETLRNLAPTHLANPRIVLLSHGSTSKNYFEDAYLARYLGYSLVEGGDLAVRNGRVMLKTLGGLLPVDVVFRRQNSDDCDPLELNADSIYGVAGLNQAVHAGNVTLANALGSGLVESPAFMAFMPQLAHALLGEPLQMAGVATHWCGCDEGLAYVLKHLDELTIYPAFRQRGRDSKLQRQLNDASTEKLVEMIRANPGEFAAQEKVVRSTAPMWRQDLQSAHVALRTYVTTSGDKSVVMPGALARVSSTLDPLEMSIQKGEGSKDAWVMSEGPVEHETLLKQPDNAIAICRSAAELPSRSAENIFWLGRQMERADAAARLLRGAASRMDGETRSSSYVELPLLLRCLADQGYIEPGYAVTEMRAPLPPIEQVLPQLVFSTSQPPSLRSVVDELFRLGSVVRDRMSLDTWRIIRGIDEGFLPKRFGTTSLFELLSLIDSLITELSAFSGIVSDSMTRTQSCQFIELGRRIECSLQIISIVKNFFIPMPEIQRPALETILEIADSLMTYRSRYMANLRLAPVLDLVLTDETNPRSLAFQLFRLAEQVDQLPKIQMRPGYSPEQRIAMSLTHSIKLLDIESVAESHSLGGDKSLGKLIQTWEKELQQLAETISHRYFIHAASAHQLALIRPQ
jgi:uncharacterized circularly permuted ATP-grasp superfamily protein/uncharacterized alpha-E superfamily protein